MHVNWATRSAFFTRHHLLDLVLIVKMTPNYGSELKPDAETLKVCARCAKAIIDTDVFNTTGGAVKWHACTGQDTASVQVANELSLWQLMVS